MTRFPARFGGRCAADCGDPIAPGDEVAYVGDVVMHVECAPDDGERVIQRQPPLCPWCLTTHVGECL